MKPDDIIDHIDGWLSEHAWRLDEQEIDFALDVRRLVEQLESEELVPAGTS
jgi:hypothetical protein